jgi:hypothetical protein
VHAKDKLVLVHGARTEAIGLICVLSRIPAVLLAPFFSVTHERTR